MPRFLYYFFIIAIALLAVNLVRSVWDRYRQRKSERAMQMILKSFQRNPWEFPEKND
jgi:uncharacterized protein YybS (DUF2232 family)